MKKMIVVLFVLVLLLSGCAEQKRDSQSAVFPGQSSTAAPSASPTGSQSDEFREMSVADVLKKGSVAEGTFSFHVVFPDPVFAVVVADHMGKDVNDMTSVEELAAYTGSLAVGVTYLRDAEGEIVRVHSLEGIGYLTGITSFANAKNDVESIPDEIGKLVNLTEINLLKSYSLKRISPEIGRLSQLKLLNAALTQLEALPSEIGQLKNLEQLNVTATKLTVIPDEVGNIASLKKLDIHSNEIEFLPDSICNLTKLEELDASYLKLTVLPENIGDMTNLNKINLFGNDIKKLPDSVRDLNNLTYLNVYDNYNLDEDYKTFFETPVWEIH